MNVKIIIILILKLLNVFFQLVCNTMKNCLQIGYCPVSEVKVETLFLLEIQKWSDNFPPEITTSRTALLLDGTFLDHVF